MDFDKSSLKKQLEVISVDGVKVTVELLDGRFTAQIMPGDTYEAMREELHRWVDRKFNDLFAAELGLMPERVAEGNHWIQEGLFDDPVSAVGAAVREFVEASGRFEGDVTLSHGGRTVKVPKP